MGEIEADVTTTMETSELAHVLVVTFPGQGHVKPLLRLSKRLASKGLLVTFSSTEEIGRMMRKAKDINTNDDTLTAVGEGKIRFEFFDDGCDPHEPNRNDLDHVMDRLTKNGPKGLSDLITRQADAGRPISCVVNNPFLPWVVDVAASAGIPVAVLWVQSCAVFSAYYHYLHDKNTKFPTSFDSSNVIELPGMPALTPFDFPSFLLEDINPYKCLTEVILGSFRNMHKASWMMVDSFEELERPIIESLKGSAPLYTIGPLLKSIQGIDSTSISGTMWNASDSCIEWLDRQAPKSVVYVSFGSVVVLDEKQTEEIARGLAKSGRSFLWVVKPPENSPEIDFPAGFVEETKERGLVVPWCPQERVLTHSSVACFLTHCGWNSSMESLCSGVPVIGFPQWGDQLTNAKFLTDVYGVGVRLRAREGETLVKREEVERCIVEVTDGGERAEQMRMRAAEWKKAAAEAVVEGGSSDRNIQTVVDGIKKKSVVNGH